MTLIESAKAKVEAGKQLTAAEFIACAKAGWKGKEFVQGFFYIYADGKRRPGTAPVKRDEVVGCCVYGAAALTLGVAGSDMWHIVRPNCASVNNTSQSKAEVYRRLETLRW